MAARKEPGGMKKERKSHGKDRDKKIDRVAACGKDKSERDHRPGSRAGGAGADQERGERDAQLRYGGRGRGVSARGRSPGEDRQRGAVRAAGGRPGSRQGQSVYRRAAHDVQLEDLVRFRADVHGAGRGKLGKGGGGRRRSGRPGTPGI